MKVPNETLRPHGDDALRLELTQLRRLEVLSMLEASTLAALVGIAVPLKYLGHDAIAVRILGPVHGLAFLTYIWSALQTVSGGGWSWRATTRLFLTAFIPFAGFTTPAFLRERAEALTAAS
jgi:integral membrane protein